MSIKHASLAILAVQNSALTLIMRHSRIQPGPRYIPTTAVVISELIKSLLSVAILLFTRWKARSTAPLHLPISAESANGQKRSRGLALECLNDTLHGDVVISVTIIAVLYTIQNNLQYLAATNLDAATFQILYQGKILTTAFFAVFILQQNLTAVKWGAIFILTSGIVLVSYPTDTLVNTTAISRQPESRLIGLAAVLATCMLSGYTGVFLELVFKKSKDGQHSSSRPQLWVRNAQLSTVSVVVALMGAALVDGRQILNNGFFYGYNKTTMLTILLQAAGGLVVSIVVTYADNILKGFATSFSLLVSTAVSAGIGDIVLTRQLAFGCVLVLVATNIYGLSSGGKEAETIDLPHNAKAEIILKNGKEHARSAIKQQNCEADIGRLA